VRVASQEPDRVAKLLLTRKSDNLTRKKVIPMRPVTTKIVGKFQVTVPPEIREIFDLKEGDLLEWSFDEATAQIRVIAKRAQLITPRLLELVEESKAARRQELAAAAPRAATSR
jgi:AbrB family looped-hinge helix DNA binding protein